MRRPLLNEAIHEVHLTFNIPMPESWSKKKKTEMVMRPHQQKPDIDNLLKAWMDCLYRNDQVIWRVSMEKRWSVKGSIEVRL
jgi:Holliday junction resolvase RusA-like endonuclease